MEAKSRLKGIKVIADASTAVNSRVVTRSMRSQIVNSLLEIADMKNDSDHNELNKYRIQRDKKDLENLKQQICTTINPFKSNVKNDAWKKITTFFKRRVSSIL